MTVDDISVILSKTLCEGETSMKEKYIKSMVTKVGRVDWVGFPGAYVNDVDLAIIKNVINYDPFIDEEKMTGMHILIHTLIHILIYILVQTLITILMYDRYYL